MLKSFLKVLVAVALSSLILGNVFFWTDENGVKHFSNVAPPDANPTTQILEIDKNIKKSTTNEKIKTRSQYKVLKVYDGDSIKVKGLEVELTIRLVGIDAPEMGFKDQKGQKFSQKAKTYLESMINRRLITIKGYGTDAYKRQLAEVFVDGDNINLEMVRSGLAEVYKGKMPKNFDAQDFFEEELKAKRAAKGMWIDGHRYQSPKVWRSKHPRKK